MDLSGARKNQYCTVLSMYAARHQQLHLQQFRHAEDRSQPFAEGQAVCRVSWDMTTEDMCLMRGGALYPSVRQSMPGRWRCLPRAPTSARGALGRSASAQTSAGPGGSLTRCQTCGQQNPNLRQLIAHCNLCQCMARSGTQQSLSSLSQRAVCIQARAWHIQCKLQAATKMQHSPACYNCALNGALVAVNHKRRSA